MNDDEWLDRLRVEIGYADGKLAVTIIQRVFEGGWDAVPVTIEGTGRPGDGMEGR